MNNKRHISPCIDFTCIPGSLDTHLSVLSTYSYFFFLLLRGNYYTDKHTPGLFSAPPPSPCGCFWVMTACSVCHRSEAKVNQIEYSCPLCLSFHPLPGLLSFHSRLSFHPSGAANGITKVCVWLCHRGTFVSWRLSATFMNVTAVKTIWGHWMLSLLPS